MGRIVLDRHVQIVVAESGLRADMKYEAKVIDVGGPTYATGATPSAAIRNAIGWYIAGALDGTADLRASHRKVAGKSGRKIP